VIRFRVCVPFSKSDPVGAAQKEHIFTCVCENDGKYTHPPPIPHDFFSFFLLENHDSFCFYRIMCDYWDPMPLKHDPQMKFIRQLQRSRVRCIGVIDFDKKTEFWCGSGFGNALQKSKHGNQWHFQHNQTDLPSDSWPVHRISVIKVRFGSERENTRSLSFFLLGRSTSATNQMSALGRSPEEAASETGHKSGKSVLGYAQNNVTRQRNLDKQWKNRNEEQNQKFGPNFEEAVSPRVPLSEIAPLPRGNVLVSSSKKRGAPEDVQFDRAPKKRGSTDVENRFQTRLDHFQDFELFCARFPGKGKNDTEMIRSFLKFERFESLKSDLMFEDEE
jgi:hypothetical protein